MHESKDPKTDRDDSVESGREIPVTDLNDGTPEPENYSAAEQAEAHESIADQAESDANESDANAEAADEESELDPLNAALAEAAGAKEAVLRAHAEMENLRKRSERENAQARKFALERIMQDLLQVIDSLERGLNVSVEEDSEGVTKLREGKQLTLKLLLKVLADHGMEEVDPAGEKFDPERHEAVGTEAASDAHPANTVVKVWQKGYVLNDRLLRPAMVVVAR